MDVERTQVHGRVGRFDRERPEDQHDAPLHAARALVTGSGDHLVWDDDDGPRVMRLDRDWLRIGRSMTADLCFDDATVSRRHALLVRGPEGIRLLDDRSLNGVFVNGERISWRTLRDGDELQIGRHRLRFVAGVEARAGSTVTA